MYNSKGPTGKSKFTAGSVSKRTLTGQLIFMKGN